MNEKASKAVRDNFRKVRPTMLKGIHSGMVMLTPSGIRPTKDIRFWKPRARFKVDLSEGATSLHNQSWTSRSTKEVTKLGIYEGGVVFPDCCCGCNKDASHYTVVEARVIKRSVRFQSPDMTQEQANRTATALSSDRFWYALPFCSRGNLNTRAVHINGQEKKIEIANLDYAKKFAELNNAEGRWLAVKHRILTLIGYLVLIVGGGMAVGFGLFVWKGINQGDWAGMAPIFPITWFTVGLLVMVGGILLMRRGGKGEPVLEA